MQLTFGQTFPYLDLRNLSRRILPTYSKKCQQGKKDERLFPAHPARIGSTNRLAREANKEIDFDKKHPVLEAWTQFPAAPNAIHEYIERNMVEPSSFEEGEGA